MSLSGLLTNTRIRASPTSKPARGRRHEPTIEIATGLGYFSLQTHALLKCLNHGMKVALVLGSGGARGYAHIGVINELEARGHEIICISGTSMGALVGGVYCAGGLEAMTSYALGMNRADVLRFADVTLGAPGLIRLQRVMHKLAEFTGDRRIEELPISYTAVATDIENANEVWFRRGSLLSAIRASISIPAVFTPVSIGNRLLVDGGLLNPLPVGPAMDAPADVIVGVSLFGMKSGLRRRSPTDESADDAIADDGDHTDASSWLAKVGETFGDSRVGRWLNGMFDGSRNRETEVDRLIADIPNDVSFGDLMMRSLDTMQARIEVARSAMNGPDVHISVPMDMCSVLDFHLAEMAIERGRGLAKVEFDKVGL